MTPQQGTFIFSLPVCGNMNQQRHSVSIWLILTLTCAVLLGFYIDKYEVDQRPTPRALFNLAGAYYKAGEFKNAVKYWRMVVDYKKIYGVDYGNTQPHGRFRGRAVNNLKMFSIQPNDSLLRRGK